MLQPQALRWCSQCAPPPPPPFNSLLLKYLSKVLLQDFQIGTPNCGVYECITGRFNTELCFFCGIGNDCAFLDCRAEEILGGHFQAGFQADLAQSFPKGVMLISISAIKKCRKPQLWKRPGQ